MEENEEVQEIVVVVDNVNLSGEQFEVFQTELVQQNENLQAVNASIGHATMFLILLCILKLYGLLRRTTKKGGV